MGPKAADSRVCVRAASKFPPDPTIVSIRKSSLAVCESVQGTVKATVYF
jgi:hypothetical protein